MAPSAHSTPFLPIWQQTVVDEYTGDWWAYPLDERGEIVARVTLRRRLGDSTMYRWSVELMGLPLVEAYKNGRHYYDHGLAIGADAAEGRMVCALARLLGASWEVM